MYYRQPKYWDSFQCIGGACEDSCCATQWLIEWTEDEIEKVKNARECSQELKELCESSFVYNENRNNYFITLGEKRRCPFLTEDNFCRIQRELGAEYLSLTCLVYPRYLVTTSSGIYRNCHMTCPEVVKKFLNDESCMELVNVKTQERKKDLKADAGLISRKMLAKHPERKHAAKIKEFFYEIISNKTLPLESCIILGALAAQSLTKLVGKMEYDKIPEAIETLRDQMHDADQLKSIENIKPNYNVKLGVTDKLIREIATSNAMDTFIDGEGKPNVDLYNRAEYLLDKRFETRPFVWRNLALNLLLEMNIPFKLENNILENYSVFVMTYVFLRYSALTVESFNDKQRKAYSDTLSDKDNNLKLTFSIKKEINTEDYIISSAAMLSRLLCHSDERLKRILRRLKDLNITSPAYLALLVK